MCWRTKFSNFWQFSQSGWVWHDFGGPSEFRMWGLNPQPPSIRHWCTVPHSTQPHSRRHFLMPNILYSSLFYHLTGVLTKTVRLLTMEWYLKNRNILALTTLKMAKWMSETCSLSLCYNTHKTKVHLLVFFINVRQWEVWLRPEATVTVVDTCGSSTDPLLYVQLWGPLEIAVSLNALYNISHADTE